MSSNGANGQSRRKRIAIVGSGISGLAALYSLRNSPHEVHIYEADDRLGGHTNTLPFTSEVNGRKEVTRVDTGFIVINTATYHLRVDTLPTFMTFAVSRDQGAFEWSGDAPFCQVRNLFSRSHWRMLFDFAHFNTFAPDILKDPRCDENPITIGEYLDKHRYSKSFRDNYLLPMTACVWSTGPEKCALDFPAVTLIRFMLNHKLLNTFAKRPQWLTIPGGSIQYIEALMANFPKDQVHKSAPVKSVTYDTDRKQIKVKFDIMDLEEEYFDNVILACHGDQACQIRGDDMSQQEKDILTSFQTTPSVAYLHSDDKLLPRRRAAWSAWNYMTSSKRESNAHPFSQTVSLTYNMNILQHLPAKDVGDVLVTLNPPNDLLPRSECTQGIIKYRHPLYTNTAVRAQRQLESIQGQNGIFYAGAWTGYGFHEDGCTSGLLAASKLDGKIPFTIQDLRISKPLPRSSIINRLWRAFLSVIAFPAAHTENIETTISNVHHCDINIESVAAFPPKPLTTQSQHCIEDVPAEGDDHLGTHAPKSKPRVTWAGRKGDNLQRVVVDFDQTSAQTWLSIKQGKQRAIDAEQEVLVPDPHPAWVNYQAKRRRMSDRGVNITLNLYSKHSPTVYERYPRAPSVVDKSAIKGDLLERLMPRAKQIDPSCVLHPDDQPFQRPSTPVQSLNSASQRPPFITSRKTNSQSMRERQSSARLRVTNYGEALSAGPSNFGQSADGGGDDDGVDVSDQEDATLILDELMDSGEPGETIIEFAAEMGIEIEATMDALRLHSEGESADQFSDDDDDAAVQHEPERCKQTQHGIAAATTSTATSIVNVTAQGLGIQAHSGFVPHATIADHADHHDGTRAENSAQNTPDLTRNSSLDHGESLLPLSPLNSQRGVEVTIQEVDDDDDDDGMPPLTRTMSRSNDPPPEIKYTSIAEQSLRQALGDQTNRR